MPYFKTLTLVKPAGVAESDEVISWLPDDAWPDLSIVAHTIFWWTVSGNTVNVFKHGGSEGIGFNAKTPNASFSNVEAFQLWAGSSDGGGFGLATAITNTARGNSITTGDSAFTGQVNISRITSISEKGPSTFKIHWDSDHADERIIHALVIGTDPDDEPDFDSALVPVGFATGAQTFTVPFCPDLMIAVGHIDAGNPGSSLNEIACLGFANHSLEQAVDSWCSFDTGLSSPNNRSNCGRAQQEGKFISLLDARDASTPEWYNAVITGVSGTTVSYTGTLITPFFSVAGMVLCLKGVASQIGVTAKPTGAAPAAHTITLNGFFETRGLLLASYQDVNNASPQTHSRLGIGAWDGVSQAASAHEAEDDHRSATADGFGFHNIGNAHGISRDDRCFLIVNNAASPGPEPASGAHAVTSSVDAAAIGDSMAADEILLSWVQNNGAQTELIFCAMGFGTAGTCATVPVPALPPAYFQVPGSTTQPDDDRDNCASLRRYLWQLGPYDLPDAEERALMYAFLHRVSGIVDGIWVHKKPADLGSVRLCEWASESKSTSVPAQPGEQVIEAAFVERPRTRPCNGEIT